MIKPNTRSKSELVNFGEERAYTEYEFDEGLSV